MRISLIYPGATWSPYDIARGYESALRKLGHEVWSFDYHNQATFYAQYLHWLTRTKGVEFPDDAAMVLASERVAIEVIDRLPDMVLIVMGLALHRRAYELVHRLGIPMALILTESPYMDDRQALILQKGHLTIAFANDKMSVSPLRAMTGCRVEYLPHSFDPQRHYPHEVDPEHRTDVFFHGTLWPEREALFSQLELSAYDAHISGAKFDGKKREMVGEIIENDEMALWYNGARIVLNPHRTVKTHGDHLESDEAWSLGPRAYEVAACGAFQICDDTRPELQEVLGESVPTYHDVEDLQGEIEYYLAREDVRQDMAEEAYQRVQNCTFENRAREILIPAIEEVL